MRIVQMRWLLVFGLLLTALSGSVSVNAAPTAEVRVFHGDAAHTGELPGPAPAVPVGTLWHTDPLTPGNRSGSSPVLADGMLFVSSVNMRDNPVGAVHALDAATGVERWHFDAGSKVVAYSLAVVDGLVYAVLGNGAIASLEALDEATGAERWNADIDPGSSDGPTVLDGVVYLSTGGAVYAFDAATGAERWHRDGDQDLPGSTRFAGAIAVADGVVFAPTGPLDTAVGGVVALDAATGQEHWRYDAGESLNSVAVVGGTVYLGGGHAGRAVFPPSGLGVLVALDAATGAVRWQLATENHIRATPAISDGTVYVGDMGGDFHAVDAATGKERWSNWITDDTLMSSPAIVDGIIYVSRGLIFTDQTPYGAGAVFALDAATGKELWHVDAGTYGITTSPIVAGGVIYAAADDGSVYALGHVADAAMPAPEPADDPDATFGWQSTGGPSPLELPIDATIAPDGTIWVVDSPNNRFQILRPDGTHLETWDGDGQFVFTHAGGGSWGGLAFGPDGAIYVADTGRQRVEKFDAGRNLVATIGSYGVKDGQFADPVAVAVDGQGNAYVVDNLRGNVQKFGPDGKFRLAFGGPDAGDGKLSYPGMLTLAADGNLWVADGGNNRVAEFDPNGTFLKAFDGVGAGDGAFYVPFDVDFDGAGNLYVVDAGHNRVVVLDPSGHFLAKWGHLGSGENRINSSGGIAVAKDGTVYIADYGNNRVESFRFGQLG
jgi:outer membrane protein assembly factor BamB